MKNKNFWLLTIFILSGLVIGSLVAELLTDNTIFWWLSYGQAFGTTTPFVLNLQIVTLTFGLTFELTIASILGLFLSIFLYKAFVK